jgi:hypothetical protein
MNSFFGEQSFWSNYKIKTGKSGEPGRLICWRKAQRHKGL